MTTIRSLAFTALFCLPSLASAQSYYYRSAPNGGNAGTLVRKDYQRYLQREPGPGASTWIQDMRTGSTPNDVLGGVLSSDEYFTRAGGNRVGYVRQLYMDVLGREPLPAEINYWVGRLHHESPRDIVSVMLRFHPRSGAVMKAPPPPAYDPNYFPDPVSPTFRDPGGPYFHQPSFYNYEHNRLIHAFYTEAQG